MTTEELFYKAYSMIERCFPSKKFPVTEEYIRMIDGTDERKADFLRLLTMELVPDDLRSGGDYNTARIEEAVKRLDISSLPEIPDGSGDFMLGVLHARGILRFPDREKDKAELQQALECFRQAKTKGCPVAESEIKHYEGWVK